MSSEIWSKAFGEMESDVVKAVRRGIATGVKVRRAMKKVEVVSWPSNLVQERIVLSSSSEGEIESEEEEENIKSPTSMEEGEIRESSEVVSDIEVVDTNAERRSSQWRMVVSSQAPAMIKIREWLAQRGYGDR